MRKKLILIGGGGHAESIIDSLNGNVCYELLGILDQPSQIGNKVNGIAVIGSDKEAKDYFNKGIHYAFIGVGSIGNSLLREKIVHKYKEIGFEFPCIIDPSAVVSETVSIGEGCFIGKRAVINTAVSLGNHCIINTGTIIEHDSRIDDFVHIAPGAVLCGGVKVGSGSHIGAGSTVIQGIDIGERSLIGAGSVVIDRVMSHVVAYGNPCKVVRRNE